MRGINDRYLAIEQDVLETYIDGAREIGQLRWMGWRSWTASIVVVLTAAAVHLANRK